MFNINSLIENVNHKDLLFLMEGKAYKLLETEWDKIPNSYKYTFYLPNGQTKRMYVNDLNQIINDGHIEIILMGEKVCIP
jgi:hypothetical protein